MVLNEPRRDHSLAQPASLGIHPTHLLHFVLHVIIAVVVRARSFSEQRSPCSICVRFFALPLLADTTGNDASHSRMRLKLTLMVTPPGLVLLTTREARSLLPLLFLRLLPLLLGTRGILLLSLLRKLPRLAASAPGPEPGGDVGAALGALDDAAVLDAPRLVHAVFLLRAMVQRAPAGVLVVEVGDGVRVDHGLDLAVGHAFVSEHLNALVVRNGRVEGSLAQDRLGGRLDRFVGEGIGYGEEPVCGLGLDVDAVAFRLAAGHECIESRAGIHPDEALVVVVLTK